ncbi:acyl-CoA carboxylase subunit epsilon [Streptomyces sp. NPDC096311]|uniref:acyl-CoA carboxylase subunit epsilon n=1 Tax=Streptomyces sp. NPDC096311 TaxID=3366083 RepID=UPI00381B1554
MTIVIDPAAPSPLVRVERGHVTDDELAALTVVLLSRATAQDADAPATQGAPRWDRPERHAPYRFPGSWRRSPGTRG